MANRPMFKVVIDTNVVISAFYLPDSRSAEVVILARRKSILNFISPQILKEIERILQKKLLWDHAKTERAVKQIRNFSEMVHPQARLEVIVDDSDNRILECAVEGQAESIISGDRHLKDLKSFQGIKIVDSATFLAGIGKVEAE